MLSDDQAQTFMDLAFGPMREEKVSRNRWEMFFWYRRVGRQLLLSLYQSEARAEFDRLWRV